MKDNKIYMLAYFILAFFPYILYGQEDKSQELNTLLNEGKYFDSRKLYKEICDVISPDMDLFYKFQMAQFMNKDDSAAIYMEKILIDYPDMFGDNTMFAYARLFDIYAVSLRNYEKSVYTHKRMVQHLIDNPYNLDEKELTLWRNGNITRVDYLKQLINQLPIKIKRRDVNNFVNLDTNEARLIVDTRINGIAQKILIDTGCDFHYIMNRKKADDLGLECAVFEMSKGVINDTEVLMKQTVVDSIEIGNIIVYNVPTTIFEHDITVFLPDSIKNRKEDVAQIDSIYMNTVSSAIGLPIMKLIGKFLIDYENQKLSFPITDYHLNSLIESNLFIYTSYLYTHLKLNEKDFIGMLDTGFDNYITIDTLFYKKYRDNIPSAIVKTEPYYIMMAHRLWNDDSYKIVCNPMLEFNNKPMLPPTENSVKIYTLQPWKYLDGIIGYDFFKKIGKRVLLDLDNMRLEAIE